LFNLFVNPSQKKKKKKKKKKKNPKLKHISNIILIKIILKKILLKLKYINLENMLVDTLTKSVNGTKMNICKSNFHY